MHKRGTKTLALDHSFKQNLSYLQQCIACSFVQYPLLCRKLTLNLKTLFETKKSWDSRKGREEIACMSRWQYEVSVLSSLYRTSEDLCALKSGGVEQWTMKHERNTIWPLTNTITTKHTTWPQIYKHPLFNIQVHVLVYDYKYAHVRADTEAYYWGLHVFYLFIGWKL